MRFAYPCVGALGVAAAVGATWLKIRDEALAAVAILGAVPALLGLAESLGLAQAVLLYAAVNLLLLWGLSQPSNEAELAVRRPGRARAVGWGAVAALSLGLVVILTFLGREAREAARASTYGGIMTYLDAELEPEEPVGYVCSHRSYLLYGSRLDRRVVYVPAESGQCDLWVEDLRRQGIRIVAMGPLLGYWKSRPEVQWLQETDGPFVRVYGRNPTQEPVLYRLEGQASASD
jgi:hypothetical protein